MSRSVRYSSSFLRAQEKKISRKDGTFWQGFKVPSCLSNTEQKKRKKGVKARQFKQHERKRNKIPDILHTSGKEKKKVEKTTVNLNPFEALCATPQECVRKWHLFSSLSIALRSLLSVPKIPMTQRDRRECPQKLLIRQNYGKRRRRPSSPALVKPLWKEKRSLSREREKEAAAAANRGKKQENGGTLQIVQFEREWGREKGRLKTSDGCMDFTVPLFRLFSSRTK